MREREVDPTRRKSNPESVDADMPAQGEPFHGDRTQMTEETRPDRVIPMPADDPRRRASPEQNREAASQLKGAPETTVEQGDRERTVEE